MYGLKAAVSRGEDSLVRFTAWLLLLKGIALPFYSAERRAMWFVQGHGEEELDLYVTLHP